MNLIWFFWDAVLKCINTKTIHIGFIYIENVIVWQSASSTGSTSTLSITIDATKHATTATIVSATDNTTSYSTSSATADTSTTAFATSDYTTQTAVMATLSSSTIAIKFTNTSNYYYYISTLAPLHVPHEAREAFVDQTNARKKDPVLIADIKSILKLHFF